MLSGGTATPESSEDSPSGASLRGAHRLAAVETCERLWALRYLWFYRPVSDAPWRMGGSLLHTCYQYWYASMMEKKYAWFEQQSLLDALRIQAQGIVEPARTELTRMALANFVHYRRRYEDDARVIVPIAIEEEFAATLGELDPGGPWPELDQDLVTCRSDMVYRDLSGGVWIMDYKSHGRSKVNPRTGLLTKWASDGEYSLNWQVLINLLVLRARIGRVDGFVIQRTTRQEPYDFDRHVLTIPLLAYQEAGRVARELVHREYEVKEKIARGEKPSPRFHACYGRYGPCDYHYVCTAATREEMNTRLQSSTYTHMPAEQVAALNARLRVVAA